MLLLGLAFRGVRSAKPGGPMNEQGYAVGVKKSATRRPRRMSMAVEESAVMWFRIRSLDWSVAVSPTRRSEILGTSLPLASW